VDEEEQEKQEKRRRTRRRTRRTKRNNEEDNDEEEHERSGARAVVASTALGGFWLENFGRACPCACTPASVREAARTSSGSPA
jgi:hypothetical protein